MLVYKMSGRLNANLGGTAEAAELLSLLWDKSFFNFKKYIRGEDVHVKRKVWYSWRPIYP